MLLYSAKDTKDISKLSSLYSDIDNLNDKISNYYSTHGKIPAFKVEGMDDAIQEYWKSYEENPSGGANDTGDFLVIDLNAIDNLTLNYGRAFDNVKTKKKIENDSDADLYIINENSHNIFYLYGIDVEGKIYFTNRDKDTEKLELRYVDGIKIYDGYSYESGNKENGIIIVSNTNKDIKYKWVDVKNGKYKVNKDDKKINAINTMTNPNTSTQLNINAEKHDEFFASIEQYGGFYIKQEKIDNELKDKGDVLYFLVEEEWSKTYDVESNYTDKNGAKAYIPKGFQVSKRYDKNTIKNGLVIKNAATSTQYVWIDVPDNVLEKAQTLDEIEKALKDYTNSYRKSGYTDTWYDGSGILEQETYNEIKNNMYKSIKAKGGFWISKDLAATNTSCSSAEQSAKNIEIDGKTSSLLFGIQWDLVCSFIDQNKSEQSETLNIDHFGTTEQEWTLEDAPDSDNNIPSQNNSVARGGEGVSKDTRTVYNYKNTTPGYRTTFF